MITGIPSLSFIVDQHAHRAPCSHTIEKSAFCPSWGWGLTRASYSSELMHSVGRSEIP